MYKHTSQVTGQIGKEQEARERSSSPGARLWLLQNTTTPLGTMKRDDTKP